MSITITKEPLGIYPAYNDSFIEFSSDLVNNTRAEIKAEPAALFPKPFSKFPDASGNYIFNLKEVAKTILNANGFKDSNFFTDGYNKSFTGLYLLQSITIEVFSETTSETLIKNYEFFKSLKQVEEDIFSNPFQLLSHSKNGVDYYLTYFEGFPFHFDIQRIVHALGKEITVKNINTGDETSAMLTTETGSYRINVDKGNGGNWTTDAILPLITGLNKLEVHEDGTFKTNLYLKKRTVCNGVYLKWFNSDGGFSHYLFEEFYKEQIKGRDIDFIGSNEFLNVGELDSDVRSIGRTGSRSLKLRAKCDENEAETLKSLYTSPLIQLYSSRTENTEGKFINVTIAGIYNFKKKVSNNEFIVDIKLPELITAKL